MLKSLPFLLAFFDRFLINFWSQLRSPKIQKSLKFHLFYCIFCKMGLPKLRSTFGELLVPTRLHSASQNPPKTLPKATPRGTKFLIDFCIAFLSFLAPFWPPTWGQLGAQDGFKIEKMRSKNLSVAHQERFEMRPCFSTPSWAVLAPFWPPTWRHFGPSWLRFGPSWLRLGAMVRWAR